MFDALKGYLPGFIAGLVMKLFGGTFLALGYTEASAFELIAGAVSFCIGIYLDIRQHKRALEQMPPAGRTAPVTKD